jgi:phosphoribosylformylglycinamidine synthase
MGTTEAALLASLTGSGIHKTKVASMPKFEAQVEVTHRPGILDPAGATVERALPALGWANVTQVRIGKSIRLVVEASDADAASAQVDEMCRRILTNPVIEDYSVTVHELTRA